MFNTNDTSLENEDWFVPNEPDEVKLALSEDSEGSLYEDMLLLQSYSTEIDELTLEANEIETIIEKNDELGNIIKTADEELKKTGTISNETALSITNKYSEVSILLNINKEEINTESALKYKKEIYNLTKENSSDEHWLKRLLNKFIEFCRNVYYRVVEYATKLGIAITRQEVAATRLATYISDNLDNFKIDKWEYMIPYADIIGNFTILKNFTVSEIEKYVKFSNGGFESDRLVDLYRSCIDKKDLSKFKSLDGIPVEYDLREYLTDYKVNKVVPIDITGKTNHVLLSYIDSSNKFRIAKKTVYSVRYSFKSYSTGIPSKLLNLDKSFLSIQLLYKSTNLSDSNPPLLNLTYFSISLTVKFFNIVKLPIMSAYGIIYSHLSILKLSRLSDI
jgi:hypothetical protein